MRRIRVMIADCDAAWCERLSAYLAQQGDIEVVCVCRDGKEAAIQLRKHVPDILVLDVVLPGMDGLQLMRATQASPISSAVRLFVVSALYADNVMVAAERAGACYYLMKPVYPELVCERLRQFTQESAPLAEPDTGVGAPDADDPPSIDQRIGDLGFNGAFKGTKYLLDALRALIEDGLFAEESRLPLGKLYEYVAQRHGTVACNVERAIRNVVSTAWRTGRLRDSEFFPQARKPKNGELIARLRIELDPHFDDRYDMELD